MHPLKRPLTGPFHRSITRHTALRTLLAAALLSLAPLSQAQQVLRVTAIPDESPTELVNKKVDMAWFGGFTFVQAQVRSNGKIIPLVQREEDEKFKSVFISADPAIKSLADLKGKDVSFGSQSSTSGHLMPRSFLLQAGLNPEHDFRRVAYSGAHDATIAAVASGKVQVGALNISVWDKFVADKKVDTSKVQVFYTTPPYYDYNWSVHADMPAALRDKITQAFLALNKNTPEGKEVLELQRATRFIPTKVENYKSIEAAARSAGLL